MQLLCVMRRKVKEVAAGQMSMGSLGGVRNLNPEFWPSLSDLLTTSLMSRMLNRI